MKRRILLPAIVSIASLLAALPCLAAVQSCRQLPTNSCAPATPAADPGTSSVRLADGQYLIKIGGDKQPSFVLAGGVQIHSNNAEIIVQVSSRRCRVAVLTGNATVKNSIERHILKLDAGAAYCTELIGDTADTAKPIVAGGFEPLTERNQWTPAFQTARCRTFVANVSAEVLHAGKFGKSLDAQLDFPSTTAVFKAHIVSPPTVLSYDIGSEFVQEGALPRTLSANFSPSGVIAKKSSEEVADSGDLSE